MEGDFCAKFAVPDDAIGASSYSDVPLSRRTTPMDSPPLVAAGGSLDLAPGWSSL
jgi:hypothetical protein